MYKTDRKLSSGGPVGGAKGTGVRPQPLQRRSQSFSPSARKNPSQHSKLTGERRCNSLSPSTTASRKSINPQGCVSAPVAMKTECLVPGLEQIDSKEVVLPQCVITKILRGIATKRREFLKLKKQLISQQNTFLEQYAQLKDLESRAGVTQGDSIGDVRVLSVSGWAAHDLLLLVRDDASLPLQSELSGVFGPNILQQLHSQLMTIPEEVSSMGADILARRLEILNLFRGKHRSDRSTYLTNLEWKAKNSELDSETEKLQKMVSGITKNMQAKVEFCMEVSKVPWLDRDTLIKKIERLQKELAITQSKVEDLSKKENEEVKENDETSSNTNIMEELNKERAAREALKEVVSAAEGMLRVARARITTLERQLKETRTELDTARRKHKDLEQLYRHRETSYDARSKKLLEVSKTGEITIETLSRQRDALELRVRELREQAEAAEREAAAREAEQKARTESLLAKVAVQEKYKRTAESRTHELEMRFKDLEEQYNALRERSAKLVDVERRRCLEYVPAKEDEPTAKETEIWKELQVTRVALARAEEEVRQSRADKDNLLKSLSRIAQEGPEHKMAEELLDREEKIVKLQRIIEEQKENEKIMEESMTQYENQLATLRLEVKRLQNYDCYVKEIPQQELQTEILDLCMQVETLTRERSALVSAAASRALMLERHERSADLFARVTRTRRELAAQLENRLEVPSMDHTAHPEVTRSLSSVCAAAIETWTALRAERARVLRLESAVLAHSLQLEREGRVRTQLERRRAVLERVIIHSQNTSTDSPPNITVNYPSLVHNYIVNIDKRDQVVAFVNNSTFFH